jgi:hypothetical protein
VWVAEISHVWHDTMHAVPKPFVAYLRVYEPLSSFETPLRAILAGSIGRGPLDPLAVGAREQDLWLRTQVYPPPGLLPDETPDGKPRDTCDVLVLAAEEVPTSAAATVGPGPLICPLDLRGRCAAALVGFLDDAEVPLRAAMLAVPAETAKAHASAVVGELAGNAVHVLSSTWTVPLPWFVLVDPVERKTVVDGTARRVSWTIAMADARRRVARAHAISRDALGDQGPTKILQEIGRWLERFHAHSAVELDYGGLVQLMTDDDLAADTSAEDVHAIVDAMESGDTTEVGERYEALQNFWSEFAARERCN